MRFRAHIDDASLRREQGAGHQEMRQVVDAEGQLETVGCYPPSTGDGGVIDQKIDAVVLRSQPPGERGNRCQVRQITVDAPDCDHMVPHRRERSRDLAANSALGACDDGDHQTPAGEGAAVTAES